MRSLGLKQIFIGLLLVSIISIHAAGAVVEEQTTLQHAMYLAMMFDKDAKVSRLGIRSIAQLYPDNVELSDCIAEHFLKSHALEAQPQNIDLLAWHAGALGLTKNARYRDVLTQARSLYSASRILLEIDDSLKAIGKGQANQYVAGTVDLAAKYAAATQTLAAAMKSKRPAFSNLQPGDDIAKVLTEFGTADDISAITVQGFAKSKQDTYALHYLGTGMVMLTFTRKPKSAWQVTELVDEAFPVLGNYTGDNLGLAQTLASLRGEAFRQNMKLDGRRIKADKSAVMLMGKRFAENPYPADKYEADGMTLAIRMVASQKTPEAIDLLRKMAAAPGESHGKLTAQKYVNSYDRRLAKKAANEKAAAEPEEPDDADESSDDDSGADAKSK